MKKVDIPESVVTKVFDWLGEENVRFFKHLKGLTGTVSPVLKLNKKRKGIPLHPVHLREGMQIRNYLRSLDECKNWHHLDIENGWVDVMELVIERL